MPSKRNDNKKFIDKFLGMFGFRRPIRSKRTQRSDFVRHPEQESRILMDDDFKVRRSEDYTREVPIVRNTQTSGHVGQSSRRTRPDASKRPASKRHSTERFAHTRQDFEADLTAQEPEAFPVLGENFEILQPGHRRILPAGQGLPTDHKVGEKHLPRRKKRKARGAQSDGLYCRCFW